MSSRGPDMGWTCAPSDPASVITPRGIHAYRSTPASTGCSSKCLFEMTGQFLARRFGGPGVAEPVIRHAGQGAVGGGAADALVARCHACTVRTARGPGGAGDPAGSSALPRQLGIDDNDRLLTHAGMSDAIDNLASRVRSVMRKSGLTIPEGWLAQECPTGCERVREWTTRPVCDLSLCPPIAVAPFRPAVPAT